MGVYMSLKVKNKKWYRNPIFPLIPIVEYREADNHNTAHLSFKWLFLTLWTLDSFSFELAIVATGHWGIGFIGILPYLRWCLTIPIPEKMSIWGDKYFSRKPTNSERKFLS